MAKFLTNASGVTFFEFPTYACSAICLLNLLAIRCLQLWCQPMGPLCLWQCLILKMYFSFYLCICHLSVSIIWIWQYTFYSMRCQICLAYIYAVERSQQRRHSKSIWSSFHSDRKVRLHLGIKSLSCRGVWIYKSQFILQAGSRKSSFLIYTNLSTSRCEASKM